jgi:PPE-repeat protein
MLGRGYEYMDPEPEPDTSPEAAGPAASVAASDQGAGPLGFAGTAGKGDTGQATGLTTLDGDAFGGGPTMPMVPGTWEPDPDQSADPGEGGDHT